jgi:hypothetical protein
MVDGWLNNIYIFYCAVRYEDEDVAFTEKLWWTAIPMGLPSTAALHIIFVKFTFDCPFDLIYIS